MFERYDSWGEVYDPKTQTWDTYSLTLTPERLLSALGLTTTNVCFVAEGNILCRSFGRSVLYWYDLGEERLIGGETGWRKKVNSLVGERSCW